MADNIGFTPEQIKAAQEGIKKTSDLAETLAAQAQKYTGETYKQYQRVSELYSSMSKNMNEQLKSNERLKKLREEQLEIEEKLKKATDAERAVLIKQMKDLRDKKKLEEESLNLIESQLKAQQKFVEEMGKSKGLLRDFYDSGKAKLVGYLVSSAQLIRSLKSISTIVQDVSDISIQSGSFFGMSGEYTKDFEELGIAAASYSSSLMDVAFRMGVLGISTEEGAQSFKQFSQIVKNPGTEEAAKDMRDLTIQTGYLSKVLGVTMPEATDFVIESQLKFSRTAAQSANTLYSVFENTERYNKALGMTVIRGRDVTKVLFDLARESEAATQDQTALSNMITTNLLQLQAQGQSYQQALKGVQGYIKRMTTEAPDWSKIMAGRELLTEFKKYGAQIPKALEDELNAASPELAKRVKDIMAGPGSELSKQMQLQEALEGTRVGLDAMQKGIAGIIERARKGGEDGVLAIKGLYNVSAQEARRIIEQNDLYQKRLSIQNKFLDSKKSEQEIAEEYNKDLKEQDKISAAQVKYLRDKNDLSEMQVLSEKKAQYEAEQALQKKKQQQEKDKEAEIEGLKAEYAKVTDTKLKESIKRKIEEKEGGPVERITETLKDKFLATSTASGGFVKGTLEALNSTAAGQLATSVAGFAALGLISGEQLAVLQAIRAQLGGPPVGRGGALLNKAKAAAPILAAGAFMTGSLISLYEMATEGSEKWKQRLAQKYKDQTLVENLMDPIDTILTWGHTLMDLLPDDLLSRATTPTGKSAEQTAFESKLKEKYAAGDRSEFVVAEMAKLSTPVATAAIPPPAPPAGMVAPTAMGLMAKGGQISLGTTYSLAKGSQGAVIKVREEILDLAGAQSYNSALAASRSVGG